MTRSIKQRVSHSFYSNGHDDVAKYLDWLSSTISDIGQSLRKTVALMLSLMAAFAIVNASPKAQLSIGSVKVSNSSLVIIFLPALISFLYFQVGRDTLQLISRSRAFTAAFSIWSFKAEENDLDALIAPLRAAYWDLGGTGRSSNTSLSERIGKTGQLGAAPLIFIGVICFEIYAYIHLHGHVQGHPRAPLILWTLSLVISCFFSIVVILQFFAKAMEDKLMGRIARKVKLWVQRKGSKVSSKASQIRQAHF
jgi:hypothetical protein